MDKRIQKTRRSIYQAFLGLLNELGYDHMRVQDVIDKAEVGRSTFYAHYASKEALLEELCKDLFHHLFEKTSEQVDLERFLSHIFKHFRLNQDRVASLLLSRNPYFLQQLRKELLHDVYPLLEKDYLKNKAELPTDFLQHVVTASFIETVTWWLQQRHPVDEASLTRYYLALVA